MRGEDPLSVALSPPHATGGIDFTSSLSRSVISV